MTSSGITAGEPQQNPVLVFSITLTQKRVRPPAWIILVLHAELASARALLVKDLDHSNLPSTLELVCDVPSLLHAQTQTKWHPPVSWPHPLLPAAPSDDRASAPVVPSAPARSLLSG